jgi:hypothetical protein
MLIKCKNAHQQCQSQVEGCVKKEPIRSPTVPHGERKKGAPKKQKAEAEAEASHKKIVA